MNISKDPHYICMNCHKSLLATNNDNLLVPYHVQKGTVRTGANVLAILKEILEYVCTCFHQLMF